MNQKDRKNARKGIKENRRRKISKRKVAEKRVLREKQEHEELVRRKREELELLAEGGHADSYYASPLNRRREVMMWTTPPDRTDRENIRTTLEQRDEIKDYSRRGEEQFQLHSIGTKRVEGELGEQRTTLPQQQLIRDDTQRFSVDNND